jgi:hypothetical protein
MLLLICYFSSRPLINKVLLQTGQQPSEKTK